MADRTWRLSLKKLDLARIEEVCRGIAAEQPQLTVVVEKEDDDIVTAFFRATHEGRELELEVSVYDCGGDGIVLSLEEDAGDNFAFWDDVSVLAEDMADALEGEPVDL